MHNVFESLILVTLPQSTMNMANDFIKEEIKEEKIENMSWIGLINNILIPGIKPCQNLE